MIDLQQLHFRYSNSPKEVLSDVTLHLPAGRIVGLLGKNGTGKSTLIYLMAGLLRPQQGEVRLEQRPVCDRTPAVLADLFVVPEHIELPSLKLSRYVSLHRDFYPHFSDELLLENLRQFDLSPDVNFSTLSTGQLKKAYISFALATCTRLLLMDEPAASLDPVATMQLEETMFELKEDYSIIIVTHNMQQAARASDYTAFFYLGDLIEYDETKKIFQDAALQSTSDYVSGRFG